MPVTTIAGGLSWPSKKSGARSCLGGKRSAVGLRLLAVTADLFLLYSYAAVMAPRGNQMNATARGFKAGD